jgi:hypothetical protein
MKRSWSAVNVLEAVDGVVSWGVDRMVRWTTEDDGEDGLLLPIRG